MKRILVVNVNWVGDVIFSTPVFKALKQAYPDSQITCLGVPRVREILESSPCVDEIIMLEEARGRFMPFQKLRLVLELSKRKFDCAFLLHRSFTRALLVFLAGIPQRVGYDLKGRGFLLTHRVEPTSDIMHRSDYYLKVIESYGVDVKDRVCELIPTEQSKQDAQHILSKHGIAEDDFLVVVNSGGNWDLKRWSPQNFSALIKMLVNDYNVKVVIPGAPKDIPLARGIVQSSGVDAVVLAGETSLKQVIALMQRANLTISADSGPLHVANSVGTETICLFGPTLPEMTGPRGKGPFTILRHDVGCNREPCYYLECPDNVCMKSITAQEVVEKVQSTIPVKI